MKDFIFQATEMKPYKNVLRDDNHAMTVIDADSTLNKDNLEEAQWLYLELERKPF